MTGVGGLRHSLRARNVEKAHVSVQISSIMITKIAANASKMAHGRTFDPAVLIPSPSGACLAVCDETIREQKTNMATPAMPAAAYSIIESAAGFGGLVETYTKPPKPAAAKMPPINLPSIKGNCRTSDLTPSFILNNITAPVSRYYQGRRP